MNRLSVKRQEQVIAALAEGSGIRATERMLGVNRRTVLRLLVGVGEACERLMDEKMRRLRCARVQVDEVWGFVGKKQGRVQPGESLDLGEQWIYVALDADSKIIPSYLVAKRTAWNTQRFMADLASRLECRIQLSSDMLNQYGKAVEMAFGGDVDYGRQVKTYVATPKGPGRYSPPRVAHTRRFAEQGSPDMNHCSTSYVERSNLSMRVAIKRMNRLTLAFSKKLENHRAAIALYMAYYNFCRTHRTLGMPPALAAGVTRKVWTISDLVALAP